MDGERMRKMISIFGSHRTRAMLLYVGGMNEFLVQDMSGVMMARRDGDVLTDEYLAVLYRIRRRSEAITAAFEQEILRVTLMRLKVSGVASERRHHEHMEQDANEFVLREFEELAMVAGLDPKFEFRDSDSSISTNTTTSTT